MRLNSRRLNPLYPLFMAVCLALPMPVLATASGFTADDLTTAAKAGAEDPATVTARQLAAATDTLRAAFVLNPETAWTTLTRDERNTLQTALGPDVINRPVELAWLMRGAAVRVGNAQAGEISALYNPVGDAWLLLGWARASGEWRVINAALVPGSRLRRKDEVSDWTKQSGSMLEALAASHAGALDRFVALTDNESANNLFIALAATRAEDRAAVYARADQWLATLAGWKRDAARAKSWADLRAILVEGEANAGSVARLPAPVRASLIPVGAIAQEDGAALLLVSPLYPELMVEADFDGSGTNFKSLTLLNLAHSKGTGK